MLDRFFKKFIHFLKKFEKITIFSKNSKTLFNKIKRFLPRVRRNQRPRLSPWTTSLGLGSTCASRRARSLATDNLEGKRLRQCRLPHVESVSHVRRQQKRHCTFAPLAGFPPLARTGLSARARRPRPCCRTVGIRRNGTGSR